MIQLLKPKIHELSIELASKVLRSGWIGLGPMVARFEKEVGEYLGAKNVVALNSGTDALRCAVALCDAPVGSIFITTAHTFVSTNHVLYEGGYNLYFADINPNDGMISSESIEAILKKNFDIGGIMVVHYGGMPCDMDVINGLAEEYGIPVIEDAAHAFGADYHGVRIGGDTKLGCFSLHAVKPLCVGDGGLLTTNSAEIAEAARKWRWLGINKSTSDRTDHTKYAWDYDVEMVGHKSHMNDITAAIGIGQLHCYNSDSLVRQQLVHLYRARLEAIGVDMLDLYEDRKSANHLMVALFPDDVTRNLAVSRLAQNEIQTGLHYKPNFLYDMYKKFPRYNGCKGNINFYERALTLPLHLDMTGDDVERICEVLNEIE
jgi:perosamine synthetase